MVPVRLTVFFIIPRLYCRSRDASTPALRYRPYSPTSMAELTRYFARQLAMIERRCVVITGASAGVGRATAVRLAAEGWHVIAHGRDPDRTEAAGMEIRATAASGARVDVVRADLSVLSETAAMADEIQKLSPRIHALLNNAGGVRNSRLITAEGNEATFAGNHLGHFLLTNRLLPLLRSVASPSRPSRVINVSSEGHRTAPDIDWNDLQRKASWVSGRNYCLAKLYNLLFTLELSCREGSNHIIANAMHPGEVASNFSAHAVPEMQAYMATLDTVAPEVPARTLAWLASAADAAVSTGRYFHNLAELAPDPAALDDVAARRLWDESAHLCAKAGFALHPSS